jgi:hypothetical protein
VRHWFEAPITTPSGHQIEEASSETRWADGADGITFLLTSKAVSATGLDIGMTGEGSMQPESLSASEIFPALCAAGELTFQVEATPNDENASVTLLGRVIAEFDASGELVPTQACR